MSSGRITDDCHLHITIGLLHHLSNLRTLLFQVRHELADEQVLGSTLLLLEGLKGLIELLCVLSCTAGRLITLIVIGDPVVADACSARRSTFGLLWWWLLDFGFVVYDCIVVCVGELPFKIRKTRLAFVGVFDRLCGFAL